MISMNQYQVIGYNIVQVQSNVVDIMISMNQYQVIGYNIMSR